VSDFSDKLKELIKERRSVRLFTGEKIPREQIVAIIEAGTWAPTGCNNQELRFLILDKEDQLNEIMHFKPFFRGVSSIVLIFCDTSLPMSRKMYIKNKSGRHLPYIDTGLALENMILHAKSMGIDSCIFNVSEYHFKKSRVKRSLIKRIIYKVLIVLGFHKSIKENFEFCLRKNLKIPKHFKIMCGVAFGYAKRYPDINTEMHGGKKVMREKVERHIIDKGILF
jgi:nitroreductase